MKKYRFNHGGVYESFETLLEAFKERDKRVSEYDGHEVGPMEIKDSFGNWIVF